MRDGPSPQASYCQRTARTLTLSFHSKYAGRRLVSLLALLVLLMCDRRANHDGACAVCLQSMRPHATTITQGDSGESPSIGASPASGGIIKKKKFYSRTNDSVTSGVRGGFSSNRAVMASHPRLILAHLRTTFCLLQQNLFPSDSFCLSSKTSTSLKY